MVCLFATWHSLPTHHRCHSHSRLTCSSASSSSSAAAVPYPPPSSAIIDILILCSLLLFAPAVMAATNQRDVNALVALHQSWSQKPSSWDITTDPCQDEWVGIQCDSSNTSVVSLLLINQQLEGTLPSVIGNLTDLQELDLSSNPLLGGSLPTEIGNLMALQRIFVQFCSFSGSIPEEIGNLKNLTHFGLTQNAFSGNLPPQLGQLTSLTWIDISSNQFSGSLPESGTSGVGLDNLTNAKHFHLENNSFSGSIPSSIFNANMALIHLLLNHNNLNGSIPTTLGDMQKLEIIRLDQNNLTGAIPASISKVQTLVTLQLNDNGLTGVLPDLSNNTNLQMIYLSNNQFDAAEIPNWIVNLTKLSLLSMDSINLRGSIPSEIFSSSANISNVTLASNNLNGTLNLTSARTSILIVDVHNNSLTNVSLGETIPEILLDGNPYCTNNQTQCNELKQIVPVSSPPGTSLCSNACEDGFKINSKSSNSCLCSLPVVGNVDFLANKIPILLSDEISSIEEDLATNLTNLTGLMILVDQVVVNAISYNEIIISVFPPDGFTAWSTSVATIISFNLKNQKITLDDIGPLVCEFTGNPYGTVTVVNKLSVGAKIGIAFGVIIFVVIVVGLTLFAIKQKKRAEKAEELNKPFAAWIGSGQGDPNIPQLKGARWFSLNEIRNCTNHFNSNNEIGEGGYGKVYKGFLETGLKVAIKRASTDSLQGAHEFRNEIELLSRVHHRNLVGLIGFCFEEGEQMLVYEFMPNGTLRESLSGKTGINMDWERRVQLALGSAKGIAYLHSEANPPIIHRDIKSSNILLDERLVAKVADFGLSKLAPVDEDGPPLSTQVKGTLGYLDPDYFMTNRLTDKSDVYSFGVVLLELLTGRLPIQDGKYVVREARTALARGGMHLVVESMVDPQLKDFPLKGFETLVELALACVQDDPDMRPSMAEVVKEIEICSSLSYSHADDRVKDAQLRDVHRQPVDEVTRAERNARSSFEYSGSIIGMSTFLEPK